MFEAPVAREQAQARFKVVDGGLGDVRRLQQRVLLPSRQCRLAFLRNFNSEIPSQFFKIRTRCG